MRGLLGLAFAGATALAAAVPVDFSQYWESWDREAVDKNSHRVLVGVDVSAHDRSGDEVKSTPPVVFQVEVFRSQEVCGYGNVTINGQALPQSHEGDFTVGGGSIAREGYTNVISSWSFHCVKVNGIPDSQLMKFIVDVVDGKVVDNIGFALSFRQAGQLEILNIETDLSVPDYIVANPNPYSLRPDGEIEDSQSSGEVIAELDELYSQLREIKFVIKEKQQALRQHIHHDIRKAICECDSFMCIVHALAQKAKHAAEFVYEKLASDKFDNSNKSHLKKVKCTQGNQTGTLGDDTPASSSHRDHSVYHVDSSQDLPLFSDPPLESHTKPGPEDHPSPPDFEYPPPPFPPPPPGPPPHHPPGPPPPLPPPPFPPPQFARYHGPPGYYGPPGPHRAFSIIKLTSIGFFCALLVLSIIRHACTPKKRADRQARRERRRALRREVHKHIITRILAKMSRNDENDDGEEYDEKKAQSLSDAEEGMSTTMSEDITEFRNAADVVESMVSATEISRPAPKRVPAPYLVTTTEIPENRPLMQNFDDGQELPAYEYNEEVGSEIGSVISDGYISGTERYTPSQTSDGSGDMLGTDRKS